MGTASDIKGTVRVLTLGCKVNQYESEMILEKLEKLGYVSAPDGPADITVINTCSVTNMSDRKSRQMIRRESSRSPQGVLAVTGCYAQMKPDEALAIDGVDLVAGTNNKTAVPEITDRMYTSGERNKCRLMCPYNDIRAFEACSLSGMKGRTRAYIKIQEGCDRFCSYCIIPFARGKARSRSLKAIVEEARTLIQNGYKEIVLTGINTALYGEEEGFIDDYSEELLHGSDRDAPGKCLIGSDCNVKGVELAVRAVNAIPGDFRIRLGSLEPTVVDAAGGAGLLKYEKLCPHMHLSLQSGSDRILSEMNRHYTVDEYEEIVNILRASDAGYGISTDVIVGFPGETEADYQCSEDLVSRTNYCKVHVFPFSVRSGTAAEGMGGHISGDVKSDRCARLIAVGNECEKRFLEMCTGMVRRVLFEEYDAAAGTVRGYTDNYINVICPGDADMLNCFANVRLAGISDDHPGTMIGEIVR